MTEHRLGAGLALLALVLLSAPSAAEAGAWTKSFGSYYAKVGADFYKPGAYVDTETGEETSDSYFGQSYGVYIEVGLFPLWPLQVSVHLPVSVGTVTFTDPKSFGEEAAKATTTRLGDLRIGFQGAILKKTVQLSLGIQVKIPLYSNDRVGDGFSTYKEVFPLPGDGQIDINPQVHIGGGIPGTPLWMTGGVGYLHRTSTFIGWDTDLDFVDSLTFTYTFGANAGPVLIMFQLDGNKNFLDDSVTRQALSLGPALAVNVWRGLSISARFQGEVWAQNAPRGISFGLGLSYERPNEWTRAQE
jgi:hypothetical protein